MGQIIIDLPIRIKRRYRLDDPELTKTILRSLDDAATATVKTNSGIAAHGIKLTAEDKADIRAARQAKKEYLRTGVSYSVDELRAEFNLWVPTP